ncbi:putative effector protein [Golovinomyces cichoracearum]|uniref:Putative effector protein n=1 Tax=Golovinomyces cichoracearum TaxID=62708 RepID=A0A420IID2_9PEZI|nr:putative effector protein [Golovinomyces cichoracearum]
MLGPRSSIQKKKKLSEHQYCSPNWCYQRSSRSDKEYPGVVADFRSLLADDASRLIRMKGFMQHPHKITSAQKLAYNSFDRNRRVVILLSPNHELRKAVVFELHQRISKLYRIKLRFLTLVAILIYSHIKAATLIQYKYPIEKKGDVMVGRHGKWKNS